MQWCPAPCITQAVFTDRYHPVREYGEPAALLAGGLAPSPPRRRSSEPWQASLFAPGVVAGIGVGRLLAAPICSRLPGSVTRPPTRCRAADQRTYHAGGPAARGAGQCDRGRPWAEPEAGEVVADTLDGQRSVFLAGLYRAEQVIPERLRLLAGSNALAGDSPAEPPARSRHRRSGRRPRSAPACGSRCLRCRARRRGPGRSRGGSGGMRGTRPLPPRRRLAGKRRCPASAGGPGRSGGTRCRWFGPQ